MDHTRKLLVSVVSVGLTMVLTAPAAFAGVDLNDDGDPDMERAGIAVVVVLLIAAVWFFAFRGGDDDTGRDDRAPEDT